jgi:hypothetical protein
MKNSILLSTFSAILLLALSACGGTYLAPVQPTLAPQQDLARAAQVASADAAQAQAARTATAQALGAAATATRSAIDAGLAVSRTVVALELERVQLVQTSVALTLTQASAQQTAVYAQGRVMSATAEFFLVGPRLYATQTAIAGAQLRQAAGDAQAITVGWMCGGIVALVALVVVISALVYGLRLVDAKVDLHVQASEQERARSSMARAEANRRYYEAENIKNQHPGAVRSTDTIGDDEARRAGWAQNMRIFFEAGDTYGFSSRDMAGTGSHNVVSNPGWSRVTQFYKQPSIGVLRELPERRQVTTWGSGWSLDIALDAIEHGTMPYPTGDPVLCSVAERNVSA